MNSGIITVNSKKEFLAQMEKRKSHNPTPMVVKCDLTDLKQEDLEIFPGSRLRFECITFDGYFILSDIKLPEFLLDFENCTFNCGLNFYRCNFRTVLFANSSSKSVKLESSKARMIWFTNLNVSGDLDLCGLEIVPNEDEPKFIDLTEACFGNLVIHDSKSCLSARGVSTNSYVVAQQLMFAGIPAFITTKAVREHLIGIEA